MPHKGICEVTREGTGDEFERNKEVRMNRLKMRKRRRFLGCDILFVLDLRMIKLSR